MKIYKISKINLKDINSYLDTLNKTKSKNSLKKNKIRRIDHYNWWFENIYLNKYCLIKNQKKIIYFWQKKFNKYNKRYFFSGWWPIEDRLEIVDFMHITNTLLKLSKNHTHVAIILKENKFSIKLHLYFKFKEIKKTSKFYNQILKIYYKEKKVPSNHLIMIKKN
ncbi:hypothetical protein N9369_02185 [Candidatus Pelagibacter sp.]|nr:hypothetical protein [Candidatus Pelagibacter sp.]